MESFVIGDTLKQTWVSSGQAPTLITAAIFTGSETVINSVSMTGSGNGHFYNLYQIPNTPGFYVSELISWVSSFKHVRRTKFKTVLGSVD